jgi:CubicO group peptidase (beta-lactamase class C family)
MSAPTAARIVAAVEARLVPLLEQALPLARVPGMALAVTSGTETLFARGFGVKRLGDVEPVTDETLFHMASVTKPFVASGIMQLVEAGRIALDTPVTRYLPYFRLADERASKITVAQLLSHDAGMPDVEDYGWDRPEDDPDALERYVRSLTDQTLIGPPGAQFRYSNIAYEVLGAVIAAVSGELFEDYISAHILAPLGMTGTTLMAPRVEAARKAAPHTLTDAGEAVVSAVYPYNRAHAPSSTLCSNARDMARWVAANVNGGALAGARVLRSETLSSMWAPRADAGGQPPRHVGLSWFSAQYRGQRVVFHSGGDIGFSSMSLLLPELGLGCVWMCNADYAPGQFLTNAALETLTTA